MNVIRIVTIAAFAASILSLFASSMTFADHSTDKGEIKKFTSDGYFVTNILKVEINGAIQPSTASYMDRLVRHSNDSNYQAILIELNTPGGMLEPTRSIVMDILMSNIPVITYVTPSGARAGSAGTFIVAASHIAAMSPGTNIGAATPVGASGEDLEATMKSKISQDATALLRSIAEQRNREPGPLENTVLTSASYTSEEALELGIIDLVAESTSQLLEEISGIDIVTSDGLVTLDTSGASLIEFEKTLLEKFLDAIGNPNITFILLTIGSIGLTLEFLQPGILVGAFVGILGLSLAFVGLGQLPVNWLGLALIAASFILFYFEAQAPGIGLYMIGGLISFVLGGFLLFGGMTPDLPGSSFSVNTWLIGGTSAVLAISMLLSIKAFAEASGRSAKPVSAQTLGALGIVRTKLDPQGTVQVGSELWSAESYEGAIEIEIGEEVVVKQIDGLKILVSKTQDIESNKNEEEEKE